MSHPFSLPCHLSPCLLSRPYTKPMCFSSVITAASKINFCINQDRIVPFSPLDLVYFSLFFTALFPGIEVGQLMFLHVSMDLFIFISTGIHQYSSSSSGRRSEVNRKVGSGYLLFWILPLESLELARLFY